MDIKDLIGYNHAVRKLYLDSMAQLPWNEVVKPRGASFDSMRNVFIHLMYVEDRWINYIIPDRFSQWVNPNFDDFKDMESLKKYIEEVEGKTKNYLEQLSSAELNRLITIPYGDKPYKQLNVETVLTHLVMEVMIHYGELSALLWQMGQEAPYLAFLRYKFQLDQKIEH